ncbi:myotubularin-related protein 14-like [Stegodyphus dumicola]|uniref:myotubularin-related protein 14-like n=1 Tax=Stegodyphus dumicola TaxID=202533 RepID=UPI0015B040A9|nr:myotubularin-related protein 14-like [Stegodyphus dumicola]
MRKDIALLQQLDVQYICDLRLRDPSKDIPQFSHSNSAYKQNYEVFKTAHLPYPAITFFSNYHIARNPLIMFDWNLVSPRFEVALPDIDYMTLYQVDFTKYQEWHLVDLTLNYLLVLQTYVTSDSLPKRGGVLLHCVAGQDRTPVFLTLLRLSLWADGLIHEFLTPKEILFFTIAYDWYLFGHDLEESLDRNWEIMHFCYSILDYVAADRFSVRKSEENGGIACRLNLDPPEETDRKEKLFEVMELFMRFYPLIERPRDHKRPPPSQPSTERPLS